MVSLVNKIERYFQAHIKTIDQWKGEHTTNWKINPENQFNKSRRKIEKQKQNKKLNLQTWRRIQKENEKLKKRSHLSSKMGLDKLDW